MHSKCSPFTFQKESFCTPKVALLQCKRTTFLRQTSYNSVFLSNFAHYERKQVIIEQQAVCRAVHSHHLTLLYVGLRSRHTRRAQQAFPDRARHHHNTVVADTGDHIYGLFPHGNSCRTVHQPYGLSTRSGDRTGAVRIRVAGVHTVFYGWNVLSLSGGAVRNRLRTRLS